MRLVKIGAEGEAQVLDVMEISRPDDLCDIADLGCDFPKRRRYWQGFNRRSLPHRSGTTLFGGRPAHAVVAVVV